jgi:hypothetical protein
VSERSEHLWTQREAAAFLHVSTRTLRSSSCPKLSLPVTGKRPIVRYNPEAVRAWALSFTTEKVA